MLITRKSMISGKEHTMEINVSEERIAELVKGSMKWSHPTLLMQNAFPDISADEREFIMTGITPEEWNTAFKED